MARNPYFADLPLAALIVSRMRDLSLTQAAVADRIRRASRGTARPTRSNICHWCRGDVTPGPTSVRWLAVALEVELAKMSMLADEQRHGGDVERRQFMIGMAATITAASVGLPAAASVARQVYESIARDDSALLSTMQTTHATDWEISQYVLQDGAAAAALATWMRVDSSAVLRVNAAGILAKLRVPSVTQHVVASLRRDDEARHLYLTAVINRVLGIPWNDASERAADVATGQRTANLLNDVQMGLLDVEVRSGPDGAARWCSGLFLGVS